MPHLVEAVKVECWNDQGSLLLPVRNLAIICFCLCYKKNKYYNRLRIQKKKNTSEVSRRFATFPLIQFKNLMVVLFTYPQIQACKMNNYYAVSRESSEEQSFTMAFCFNFWHFCQNKQFSFSFYLFLCYWKDLHLPFPWWRSQNDGLSIKNN